MCVCMYVVYVFMYVVCMYVCSVCMYVCTYVCYVYMYVVYVCFMYLCVYVCMYVLCMYVCMYVLCMCVCMHVCSVCMYACMYTGIWTYTRKHDCMQHLPYITVYHRLKLFMEFVCGRTFVTNANHSPQKETSLSATSEYLLSPGKGSRLPHSFYFTFEHQNLMQ